MEFSEIFSFVISFGITFFMGLGVYCQYEEMNEKQLRKIKRRKNKNKNK